MSDRTSVVLGVALGLLVGVLGSATAVRLSTGQPDAAATPSPKTAISGTAYPGDPEQEARLVQSEAQRIVYVRTVAATAGWNPSVADGPYRVRTGATHTLVLPARAEPYRVTDLESLAPDTFQRRDDGAYLLSESILVLGGASLALAAPEEQNPEEQNPEEQNPETAGLRILLKSDAESFVSIVSAGGSIAVDGRADAPVSLESWDAAADGPDLMTDDGRAYLRVVGGRAEFSHADVAHLGFWSGNTGGLALTGTDESGTFDALLGDQAGGAQTADGEQAAPAPDQALGGAQTVAPVAPAAPEAAPDGSANLVSAGLDNVTITGNAYGLFVASADAVAVRDSRIEDSLVDGLVFHRHVSNSAVRETTSSGNAVNGFRVARSSTNLSFNDVVARDNGRDGIALDGQPLAKGPSATGTVVATFGDNRVTGSQLTGNGRYGIAVSGGSDIVLSSNTVTGNESGIVVDHGADAVDIVANRLVGQSRQAVALRDGVDARVVTNRIAGGDTAVYVRNAAATVQDNVISGVSNHGVTLLGDVGGVVVARNAIAGHGNIPIFAERSTGGTLAHNDTLDWHPAASLDKIVNALFQPLTIVWIVLALVVLVTALSSAGRRPAIRHPYAERAPLSTFTRGVVSRDSIREVNR